MIKKLLYAILSVIVFNATITAQGLAVNSTGAAPVASAMLDVTSTTKGMLIPRMTTAQRTAIASPATGLIVYDNTTNSQWIYNGTAWVEYYSSVSGWSRTGNTLAATGILGSLNAFDVSMVANNLELIRLNAASSTVTSDQLAVNAAVAAPATSAMLDVSSTTKGVLIPRMTTAQRTAIASPATGLIVYDNTTNSQWIYNGTAWVEYYSSVSGWSRTGNTLAATGILGSLNAFDVSIVANNIELIRLNAAGFSVTTNQLAVNVTSTAPATSAMLDVSSTTKGVLVPRMSTAQRTAIAAPATGLMVYDTTTGSFWYYNGTVWLEVLNANTGWSTTGNTIAATNLIGSINAQPLRFFCNNIERFRINPTDGEIVAGATASPYAGDLLNAVGTLALPFALSGYTAQSGSATWGETLPASTSAYSSVQGVYTGSGPGAGVLGNYDGTNVSTSRTGVVGVLNGPDATNGGAGVTGYSTIAAGTGHIGVLGYYSGGGNGMGVVGVGFGGGSPGGAVDIGVMGLRANNANYSGYFNGNHVIANGTKSASVGTQWGNQLLYVTESPEVWFEDIGRGKLVNGTCTVQLDSIFKQVTVIDAAHPMHIFVQAEGESEDLYVVPGTTSFTVKEKHNGQSNTSFSYRIMAKRVNFQDHRYGNDPLWGAGDTRIFMQYAPPPPIDYNQNVLFQQQQRQNYKPTPLPQGFTSFEELMKDSKERSKYLRKPKKEENK